MQFLCTTVEQLSVDLFLVFLQSRALTYDFHVQSKGCSTALYPYTQLSSLIKNEINCLSRDSGTSAYVKHVVAPAL